MRDILKAIAEYIRAHIPCQHHYKRTRTRNVYSDAVLIGSLHELTCTKCGEMKKHYFTT